ncbi:flagellar assembly protein FliH [Bacillus alveayuensis]|jgi:flagellar assembly protein FliH|uniref:flagellar assembly protein FliH n=1 Tax=Aeribacillus alveayuensis TaxID=279215 RepID=UPI0005D0F730|nr:flagellar assembly protein FliH [Bacillus alveayuensis]
MISLSKIIKAPFTKNEGNDKRIIEIRNYFSESNQAPEINDDIQPQLDVDEILEKAKAEAEKLKREAQLHYEAVQQQILQEKENWHEEKQQLVEMARKEGYEIGLQQGYQDGLAQYHQLIEQAKQIVESAHNEYYQQIEAANETIFLIGLKVAEKILDAHLNENSEHFVSLVKRAIREVREHSEVKIYIHPAYYDAVVQQKDELKELFHQEVDLFIYPDVQLPEHGCIIESPFGRIDASVDTQLQQIKEKLRERFEHLEEA